MNLENVTAELRPRSDWEAADFGVRMIRRDAAAIYRVWFGITLPLVALTLLAIVYTPYPTLATFIYWWLEPVTDGPILRMISRRLFGENADVRATLRSVPQLAWQNKLFLITPYRLHLARSVAMPVTQLEGLQGTARRSRAKILNLKILNHGIGVTVAYQHLVLALYLGIVLIGFALVPTAYQNSIGEDWIDFFITDSTTFASALALIVFYIAQTALHPWFVGAGFGLYINCRTQLEAWDIEVTFRRMAQRRANKVTASVVLALLFMPAILLPGAAYSQDFAESKQTKSNQDKSNQKDTSDVDPGFSGYFSDDEVATALGAVLDKDALNTTRTIEEWQAIDQDKPEPDTDKETSSRWINLIQGFVRFMSYIVEFGLWIGVALILLLIFATRSRWLPFLSPQLQVRSPPRRVSLSSGEISAETLPDNVPAEVMRLWNEVRKREALSLLYRASVFAAVTRHGVRLPSSATEGECVRAMIQQVDRSQSEYFTRVVSVWIRCAYGFEDPDAGTIPPLCKEWLQHYGEPA